TALFCPARQDPVSPRALHHFPTRRSSDLDQFCIFGGAAQPARKAQPTTHTGGCAQAALFDCAIFKFGEGAQRKAALRVGGLIARSEEHTSELQSRFDLVCRLLLEKRKRRI